MTRFLRRCRPQALVVATALGLCVVSAADAKLGLSFALSGRTPSAHERVVALLRSDFDPGATVT